MTLESSPNTVREQRRATQARQRRNRTILIASLVVVVLAGLAFAVYSLQSKPGQSNQNPVTC